MSYKIIRDANNRHQTGREIVAILDTDEDLAALGNAYAPGSQAIVAQQGGNTYVTNASGEWTALGSKSGPSGGSGLPSGSKPNQYIATDKDGNAKWEDKLAWSEVTKSHSDTLTWDGVLSDDDLIKTIGGYTLGYHHVSNEVPSLEHLSAGGICTMYQDSEFKTVEFTSEQLEDRSSEGLIMAGAVLVVCRDNVTVDGLAFSKAGIYFMSAPDVYVSGFKLNGYRFEVVTETIHPIDKKYLPSRCGLPMLCLTVDGDSWKVTSDTEVADALEILGQTDFVTVICAVKYEGKTNYATLQSIEYNAENAFYVLKFSWYDGDFYVRVSRELGYVIPME